MSWILLCIAALANAGASVIVKVSVDRHGQASVLIEPWSYLASIWTWFALFLYGLAFVLYTATLSYFPLGFAQPAVTSGGIILVSIAAVFFFDEDFHPNLVIGTGLVILGLVFIGSRSVS